MTYEPIHDARPGRWGSPRWSRRLWSHCSVPGPISRSSAQLPASGRQCPSSRAPGRTSCLDLSLEDGSGLELARTLYRSRSKTRVLVMTGFGDRFAAKEAMAAGVAGYLLENQSAADSFVAIDVIRRDGRYVAPTIAAQLRSDELSPTDTSPLESLSHRERDISPAGGRDQQQGSRPTPLHQRQDGRDTPHQHCPQARRSLECQYGPIRRRTGHRHRSAVCRSRLERWRRSSPSARARKDCPPVPFPVVPPTNNPASHEAGGPSRLSPRGVPTATLRRWGQGRFRHR